MEENNKNINSNNINNNNINNNYINNNNINNNNINNNNINNNNINNNNINNNNINNIPENSNQNTETNFKDLPIEEQIKNLEKTLQTISQKIYQERSAEIANGSIEIVDISYNVTTDNEVVYDITMKNVNTGEEIHELYNKNLEKINLDKSKIQELKIMGYDTSIVEKQLEEMENLKNNPNKISLSKLKEQNKEVDELSNSLGISREELAQNTIIDKNQEVKIKANELGGTKYDRISGEEKVSTHYNMNDVIGGDFASYQIVKTNNGSYKLFGIDKDGFAKEIGNNLVEPMQSPETVKLIQDNGEVIETKVYAAFRIKSPSEIDRDQVVGLSNDGTSRATSFYGRGAITNENIIGVNVPTKINSENRVKTEHLMDTLETNNNEFNTVDEYIKEAANKYSIDEEELREEVYNRYEDYAKVTKEDIEGLADFMAREPSLEPKRPGEPK